MVVCGGTPPHERCVAVQAWIASVDDSGLSTLMRMWYVHEWAALPVGWMRSHAYSTYIFTGPYRCRWGAVATCAGWGSEGQVISSQGEGFRLCTRDTPLCSRRADQAVSISKMLATASNKVMRNGDKLLLLQVSNQPTVWLPDNTGGAQTPPWLSLLCSVSRPGCPNLSPQPHCLQSAACDQTYRTALFCASWGGGLETCRLDTL